ncbi:hypothetical protein F220043C3_05730 [Enterocloster asparagiformis]
MQTECGVTDEGTARAGGSCERELCGRIFHIENHKPENGGRSFNEKETGDGCDDGGDAAGRRHSDDIPRGGERVSDLRVQQL